MSSRIDLLTISFRDRQSISSLITMIQACPGEPQVNVEIFRRKLHDEHEILRTETDLRALEKAMAAFAHLQHVQILRVQDREDEKLLDFVRYHDNAARPLIELNWASACLHSTKTIGSALLASHSKCTRFSSPMMSPLTAFTFGRHPPSTFSMLAVRLTCLELHFDGDHDLDARMLALSGLFNHVFKAAVNMEAVHVGFPSHRPLSLPLETLFHNVQWRKLIAFGVQGWKLDSGEIIGLARRHKDRLKGLRLRDVLLKDGSTWKDTLGVLRSEMLRLEWVSLRRIGYARIFDEQRANPGIEVSDDAQGSSSESDYESDIESEGVSEDFSEAGPATSDYTSESDHGSDDEYGPAAHVLSFPSQLSATDRLGLMPWCTCGRRTRPERMEDLDDDDGSFIDNEQRKRWEKWVLGRCPEHDVEI